MHLLLRLRDGRPELAHPPRRHDPGHRPARRRTDRRARRRPRPAPRRPRPARRRAPPGGARRPRRARRRGTCGRRPARAPHPRHRERADQRHPPDAGPDRRPGRRRDPGRRQPRRRTARAQHPPRGPRGAARLRRRRARAAAARAAPRGLCRGAVRGGPGAGPGGDVRVPARLRATRHRPAAAAGQLEHPATGPSRARDPVRRLAAGRLRPLVARRGAADPDPDLRGGHRAAAGPAHRHRDARPGPGRHRRRRDRRRHRAGRLAEVRVRRGRRDRYDRRHPQLRPAARTPRLRRPPVGPGGPRTRLPLLRTRRGVRRRPLPAPLPCGEGFRQPSVYCADLQAVIRHIAGALHLAATTGRAAS